MDSYGNLFFQLRTEPRYLAKLAYLIPPSTQAKQQFAETVILTMYVSFISCHPPALPHCLRYANAFSPLEELMLMELLQKSVEQEIAQVPLT